MPSSFYSRFSLSFILILSLELVSGSSQLMASENKSPQGFTLDQMRQTVLTASEPSPRWGGPTAGPEISAGKIIAIIADDLRNGGILGVAHGVQEATQAAGWRIQVFDTGGTAAGREKAATDALASKPDGLILDGADANVMSSWLQPFFDNHIPVVGWHVSPVAGSLDGPVAINVSTDPLEVAKITAMAAIVESNAKAAVVIFTDSHYEIAMAKANAMADVIRSCASCSLLEIRDVAISDSARVMPSVTRELLVKYGERWTHALAINDIYFDYAVPEFNIAGISAEHIHLLSAGDGSSSALLRIQSGTFQTSTVAEPLNLHGWQLVDELNRLMQNEPVSGYITPPHLVTKQNIIDQAGTNFNYDPDNGYRDIYLHIWRP